MALSRRPLAALPPVLLLAACGGSKGTPAGSDTSSFFSFAGTESCARCHGDEAERWRGSPHDLAMQPAAEETVLGDFSGVEVHHLGSSARFHREGRRFSVDTQSDSGVIETFEVAYTFGVFPLQQYLVDTGKGRLQVLPWCWDSRSRRRGGQRWFHLYADEPIPPGDELFWTGVNQRWNSMCAECHSTGVRRSFDPATGEYRTSWEEIDVGCEACHGPGAAHVAWAEASERGEAPPRPANLGLPFALTEQDGGTWTFDASAGVPRRDPPREAWPEIDACGPCHSRRSTLVAEHAPGERYHDGWRLAPLEEPLYFADGQIREEVYVLGSFLSSRMYAAGVTCGDCHEPHGLELRAPGDDVCTRCHPGARYAVPEHHHHPPDSPGARCVECHMPERSYMVVDPRRDHSLRVPRPALSAALGAPNACNRCHEDRDAAWAARAIEGWYPERRARPHWSEALAATREASPGALERLADLAGNAGQPGIARAAALDALARLGAPAALTALFAGLDDPDPLARAAAVRGLVGLPAARRARVLAPLLADETRLVRVEAALALAGASSEIEALGSAGALRAALAEVRASLASDLDRASSHVTLALLALDLGERSAARRALETALALEPDWIPARANLADLLRSLGKEDRAREILREGLERAPRSAALHHALGLALVRAGEHGAACEELARAAELAPGEPRFALVHAICVHDLGERERALELLDAAVRRHPWDLTLLEALAAYLREAGRAEEASAVEARLATLVR